MQIDERSLKEIKADIESRMLYLGRIIIARRVSFGLFIFSFIMAMYNILRWSFGTLTIDCRCIVALFWICISIILIILYNNFQILSLSIKQEIFNDKKILSKL